MSLRYTAGHRKVISEHYRNMKHIGRRLAEILLISIALAVGNAVLMFYLGFIYRA